MSNADVNQIWSEWKVEGEPLGRGSFGVVYKAVRRDNNIESFAAIKAISIPQNQSEIDSLRSEGLSEEETKTYLKGIVNDFVSEIQMMESFEGTQNIVNIQDYKVVEKKNTIGWDIYIRMELLTPFNTYITRKTMSEKEVIQLGIDICTALELCAKRNVIHRDIKLENILVNKFGNFKLGDFGIARRLENVTESLSRKGTPNYIAPEIIKTTNYDSRVDIYSLGLVLYRLLNKNRLPFFDTSKQLISRSEREAAIRRRIDGEPLPAPCDASPLMAQVILCACAYEPNKRFASATAMKNALIHIANHPVTQTANNSPYKKETLNSGFDRITSARPAPKQQTNDLEGSAIKTFNKQKKSKVPVIIAVSLTVGLIFGSAKFVLSQFLSNSDNDGETAMNASQNNNAAHSYLYMVDDCSWSEAFENAKAQGGYLARIETPEEYSQILSEIQSQELTDVQFRIGARRESDGEDYYWVDENNTIFGDSINSVDYWSYSEWLPGEPSYHFTLTQLLDEDVLKDFDEEYVEIYFDENANRWVWNDIADAVYNAGKGEYGYIVEFDY